MDYFAGVDVGSLSTDSVIINENEKIMAYAVVETGANSTDAAVNALAQAAQNACVALGDIVRVVSTGYGRVAVPGAHKKVTEITCHGVGSAHLFPQAQTVIDIGGQDSKVIRLAPGGKVSDFVMNDKCAAGTGRFLEVMAAKLQVDLDQMGPLSLRAQGEPVKISSVCTVFAESEVISLVAQNHPRERIIKGIHKAIVNRVWNMVKGLGEPGVTTMSGGVAKNRGVTALLEERLGAPLLIHDEPQIVGALGAALLARRQA